jgi:hypothetical protein
MRGHHHEISTLSSCDPRRRRHRSDRRDRFDRRCRVNVPAITIRLLLLAPEKPAGEPDRQLDQGRGHRTLMGSIPRRWPPYLHRQISRHGRPVWYVRRGDDKRGRIRIREEYGRSGNWDDEFPGWESVP